MRLAIIGAGMAGLAAARKLRQLQPALEITLYEQHDTIGGRVCSVRRNHAIFDHGAQYIKAATPALEQLLTRELPSDDLRDIGQPVWIFNGANQISTGDPAQNADPKWIYRQGLDQIGTLLAHGLDIRRSVAIDLLQQRCNPDNTPVYDLFNRAQTLIASADMVLITAPAPQSAELLNASTLDPIAKADLLAELARISYRRCLSLALAYAQRIERPFYALVNTDRQHPISWLALEHAKGPDRCPPDQSLLLAQMAPQWSNEHWDTPIDQLAHVATKQIRTLLDENLPAPLWCDVQRWRYALPDGGANVEYLNNCMAGLVFAGDYTAGQGRVHLAIESGWRAAITIDGYVQKCMHPSSLS